MARIVGARRTQGRTGEETNPRGLRPPTADMKPQPPNAMPVKLSRNLGSCLSDGAATHGREKPGGNYGHSNGDVNAASYSDRLGFDSRGVHRHPCFASNPLANRVCVDCNVPALGSEHGATDNATPMRPKPSPQVDPPR
jgi:hypothetical protein